MVGSWHSCDSQCYDISVYFSSLCTQGVRDPEGAQLLLFTASKHDSKSCDHKTSMQLLFLILDQISER